MKNPNGYGTVVKLSGNRRKPYAVRKTVGFDERGYPIYKAIGYAATREEGLMMLAEYNHNPFNLDWNTITVVEVYKYWLESNGSKLTTQSLQHLKSAWLHCEAVYKIKYKDLRSWQMQDCIDKCGYGYSTQAAIKNLFKKLDRFAFEHDIINKCYSELLTSAPVQASNRVPFTTDEINILWNIASQEWIDTILFMLYTGFRIGEMITIESQNVDINQMIIKGGIKTSAGKNRIVPIHPRILSIVQNRLSDGHTYLFSYNHKKLTKSSYYIYWGTIMQQLGMQHTPHDCRHTVRTMLDSAGANKKCMDLIMGHASKDVGERVYTHKTVQELAETIQLLN